MSGTADEWASHELIYLAEVEQYDATSGDISDPLAWSDNNAQGDHDADYNITRKALPADSAYVRIIRILEDLLRTGHEKDVDEFADRLDSVVLSHSVEKRHGAYFKVIEMIIGAIKFVDGQDASMMIAQLVVSLASRGDLVNTTSADITYDLGAHGFQPVVIAQGAALTGEGDLKLWSEMPGFESGIEDNLDQYPGLDPLRDPGELWPGNSWQNFTRFCGILSDMFIQGRSPLSALEPAVALRLFFLGVEETSSTHNWRMTAAVYMAVYGHEIRRLCEHGEYAPACCSEETRARDETFSLERWNWWHTSFTRRATSAKDEQERFWAAKASARMDEVERSVGAYWQQRTLDLDSLQ